MNECFLCSNALEPAPTRRPWLSFNGAGMHNECIKRLADLVRASTSPAAEWPGQSTIAQEATRREAEKESKQTHRSVSLSEPQDRTFLRATESSKGITLATVGSHMTNPFEKQPISSLKINPSQVNILEKDVERVRARYRMITDDMRRYLDSQYEVHRINKHAAPFGVCGNLACYFAYEHVQKWLSMDKELGQA